MIKISERYIITGVQLGLLYVEPNEKKRKKLVDEIIDKQFIGNSENKVTEDCKKYVKLNFILR